MMHTFISDEWVWTHNDWKQWECVPDVSQPCEINVETPYLRNRILKTKSKHLFDEWWRIQKSMWPRLYSKKLAEHYNRNYS